MDKAAWLQDSSGQKPIYRLVSLNPKQPSGINSEKPGTSCFHFKLFFSGRSSFFDYVLCCATISSTYRLKKQDESHLELLLDQERAQQQPARNERQQEMCPWNTSCTGPDLTFCFVICSQTSQGMVEPLPAVLRSTSESKRHYGRQCCGLKIKVSNL